MNRWNIPTWLEREIKERDRSCVYCGVSFNEGSSLHGRASWEHIVNDARIVTRENVALCCIGCNASKGAKPLSVGFSPYEEFKAKGVKIKREPEIMPYGNKDFDIEDCNGYVLCFGEDWQGKPRSAR
jgi:hypothetical protein